MAITFTRLCNHQRDEVNVSAQDAASVVFLLLFVLPDVYMRSTTRSLRAQTGPRKSAQRRGPTARLESERPESSRIPDLCSVQLLEKSRCPRRKVPRTLHFVPILDP